MAAEPQPQIPGETRFPFWRCSPRWFFLAAVLASSLLGCRPDTAPSKRTIEVAAAADLKFAFDELAPLFEQQHPNLQLHITYGSSGNIFAQLSNRAPFDVFFSADRDYPRRLLDEGLAVPESEFVYAIGHLVLWVPKDSPLNVEQRGSAVLTDARAKKIAIANPKFAPYGRAAVAALKKLGLYEQIQARLVLGDNIAQTAQFVESGAADVGVLSLSLAMAPALRDKGHSWRVPDQDYPTLEQAAVMLTWAKDRAAVQTLCEFVRGTSGRSLLKRYGFTVPGE